MSLLSTVLDGGEPEAVTVFRAETGETVPTKLVAVQAVTFTVNIGEEVFTWYVMVVLPAVSVMVKLQLMPPELQESVEEDEVIPVAWNCQE